MKTIIYNGRINSKNGLFDGAVLIEDGIISKMGSDSEILASKDEIMFNTTLRILMVFLMQIKKIDVTAPLTSLNE